MPPPPRLSSIVDGLPSFVPFVGPEELERRRGAPYAVRLGANESRFPISPRAVEAMTAVLEEARLYGDPECWELRTALAERLGIDVATIMVGAGIDDLLGLVARAFLDPGSVAVMSDGAYPTFGFMVRGAGGRVETVPYRDDQNDLAALADAAHRTHAPLVFLANPDNPSGSWVGAAPVRDFLAALPDTSTLVLDEAYAEFAPDDRLALDTSDPRVVRLRTFSKAYGLAGMRVGYCIAAAPTIAALDRIRNHFGVGRVAQAGALAALLDTEHLARVVAAVASSRSRLAEMAQALGFTPLPSLTNFVSIDVGGPERSAAIVDELSRAGIFVRRPGRPPLDRCVRITAGPPADLDLVAAALAEIAPRDRG